MLFKISATKHSVLLLGRSRSTSFQLNSHVVYFDVTVVGGGDQQLGVGGESEGSDGHGVTWTEGKQSACIKSPPLTLKALFLVVFDGGFRSGVSGNHLIENAQLTFQRVEKFPSGDVKNIDDSVDRSAGQILSIRALRGEPAIKRIID